jgi:predicted DNA-binding transcriptional regulator AlpA
MTGDVNTVRHAHYVDTQQCAERYKVSGRHWNRLVDSGRAPQPIRFGRLTRWSLSTLEEWEAAGCPPCRQAGRAVR